MVVARAPGRVNIIGDHTDYTGGLCLPMAIDRGVTVEGYRTPGDVVRLTSESEQEPAVVPLDVSASGERRAGVGALVAAVVAQVRPANGFAGTVRTTLPAGIGLSSSAALGGRRRPGDRCRRLGSGWPRSAVPGRRARGTWRADRHPRPGRVDLRRRRSRPLARLPHGLGDAGCVAATGRRRVGRARPDRLPRPGDLGLQRARRRTGPGRGGDRTAPTAPGSTTSSGSPIRSFGGGHVTS